MKILIHKHFEKDYKKLRPKVKLRWREQRDLFIREPFNVALNNHSLRGRYEGFRSIDVTGDYRALYKHLGEKMALFIRINTHRNLYG
jgi:addiction module RelE/StbE family toxin